MVTFTDEIFNGKLHFFVQRVYSKSRSKKAQLTKVTSGIYKSNEPLCLINTKNKIRILLLEAHPGFLGTAKTENFPKIING